MSETSGFLDSKTRAGPYSREASAGQPHVILITVDMVPPEFVDPRVAEVVGMAPAHTPALDGLRRDGLSFSNACCTSPLCGPSRAAFLTGRHSYLTTNNERAHDGHAVRLRDDDPIFPAYLKAAGYWARHVGKCHVGSSSFVQVFSENDRAWDRWSPPWYDDIEYGRHLRNLGIDGFDFSRRIQGVSASGQGAGNFYGGWVHARGGGPFPPEATYSRYTAETACEAVRAGAGTGKPLYLQVDFFEPHQPFAVPTGLEERERQLRAHHRLPAGQNPRKPEPRVYSLYRKNWGLGDPAVIADYRIANQLQFEILDSAIGCLLTELKARGLYDQSWIVLLADHGEMNGRTGLVDKGVYLNPIVIGTPLVVKPPRDAGAARGLHGFAGTSCDVPVSLLDVAPTVLAAAGIRPSAWLDGVDLAGTALTGRRDEERPILFEAWNHVVANPCIGTVFTSEIDGRRWFYSYNACDPVKELYALEDRRGLVNHAGNVADHPMHAEAIRTLARRLDADERWVSFSSYLNLEYAETIGQSGDRQHFVR
jgi:arylsulfatase A-like enzyme